MKFIDMHCDTLLHMYKAKSATLRSNGCGVDFERMKRGGSLAQFFAVFLPSGESLRRHGFDKIDDEVYVSALLDIFDRDIAASSDIIAPARNCNELLHNERGGKMSAFLTFEDGRAVAGSLERLRMYYERGIRLITLTWNSKNCFGSPNSADPAVMAEGLTAFGREAIEVMGELGIVVDVSHLSDGGFWDVAKLSKKPFVASHSNARALSPHMRNLTDGMIRALGEAGGCAGINFAPAFLGSDITARKSTVAAMTAHALHIRNIGGAGCVALGSDLDGIRGELEIGSIADMPLLLDALKSAGFSESELEAAAYGNVSRVVKEVMK